MEVSAAVLEAARGEVLAEWSRGDLAIVAARRRESVEDLVQRLAWEKVRERQVRLGRVSDPNEVLAVRLHKLGKDEVAS